MDRVEKTIELKAPVSRVWRALTDYNEFGKWFGVRLQDPFVPGQVSRGQITTPGYEHIRWDVVVEKMEPERLFSFSSAQEGDAEALPTIAEFFLQETPKGTLLHIVESGFDKLPSNRRDEAFRRNEAGWSAKLKNIAKYVEQS